MDATPHFMDILTMTNRGEAFYFRPLDQPPSGRACVLSLGIREVMPPGFIRHVGLYADWGYLFMDFHGPALVDPTERPDMVERGFILWRPGVVRHYGNPDAPWEHSWLNATGSAIDEAVAEHGVLLDRVMHLDVGAISLKYLHALYDEVQEHVVADDQIVEGLIGIWIREIARAAGTGGVRPPARVTEARRFIEAHYAEPLELEALARRAALSVSQFSMVFRAHFGVPPMQYAYRLRLRKAAQLLGDSTLAIGEVAARVGYEDPLHFSRQFRKYMGQNPRLYRASRGPKTVRKR
ncbi:MAG TPA: AraC family transcriptional regulator [Usitatibacter sp.]